MDNSGIHIDQLKFISSESSSIDRSPTEPISTISGEIYNLLFYVCLNIICNYNLIISYHIFSI